MERISFNVAIFYGHFESRPKNILKRSNSPSRKSARTQFLEPGFAFADSDIVYLLLSDWILLNSSNNAGDRIESSCFRPFVQCHITVDLLSDSNMKSVVGEPFM